MFGMPKKTLLVSDTKLLLIVAFDQVNYLAEEFQIKLIKRPE